MRRFLNLFVFLPIAIVVVALSVANRGPVTFALDPLGDPPRWSIVAPFFLFLFAAFAIGGLMAGVATWLGQAKWRRSARAERAKAQRLQQEVERLHERTRETVANLPALARTVRDDDRDAA